MCIVKDGSQRRSNSVSHTPEIRRNIAKCRFHIHAKCNHACACEMKRCPLSHDFLSGISRAFTRGMWDLIFVVATVAFFAVSLAYVEGCQRL